MKSLTKFEKHIAHLKHCLENNNEDKSDRGKSITKAFAEAKRLLQELEVQATFKFSNEERK